MINTQNIAVAAFLATSISIMSGPAVACAENISQASRICFLAGEGDLLVAGGLTGFTEEGDGIVPVTDVLVGDEQMLATDEFEIGGTHIYSSSDGMQVGDEFLLLIQDGVVLTGFEANDGVAFREQEPVTTETLTEVLFLSNQQCRNTLYEMGLEEAEQPVCCATTGGAGSSLMLVSLFLSVTLMRRRKKEANKK